MAQPHSSSGLAYIPALDGVRAVSILLVILSHLGLDHVLPGAFGVTLFFFISGTLITRQLLTNLNATGRLGLAQFYARRALRLMPASTAYIVVAGGLYALAGGRISPGAWLSALFYGANYYELWSGYRTSLAGVRQPFDILWSLAIEEHFYLLWPLLLGCFWRARWAFWAVLGFCVLVLAWRCTLFESCFAGQAAGFCAPARTEPLLRYNQLYLGTDTRADSIAWGVMLALAWRRFESPRPGWILAGLCLLALSFALPGPFGRYVMRPSLQGASLLALIPAVLDPKNWLHALLTTRPAIVVGRLSYGLYLWHWGALGCADWVAGRDRPLWLAIAVPLTLAMASLSYFAIEQPMLRLRRRAGSHAPLALSGS